jgi:uncharacterized glyoxalase superfamily protein PhnB
MAEDRDDAALAAVEAMLEGLPDPRFRQRLRQRLERSIAMTTGTDTQTVIPYVMTQDIEPVIAFARQVFGGVEVERGTGSAGGVHCEMRIGNATVMFGGATPDRPVKPRLTGLHVYVDDVDAVYQRAIEAGGTSLSAPEQRPYGERSGFVKDTAGNHWYIATRTEPTYFAKEPRTVTPNHYVQQKDGRGAKEFLEFLQAAFQAEPQLFYGPDGTVVHGVAWIHGSALELGEGEVDAFGAPAAFVLNVENLDAAYDTAVRAGATPLFAPAAQAFGGRMAGVADPWGNEWYLASR